MFELHLREQLCDAQRGFHVAERGGENELVPGHGQLANHSLRVGGRRHAFHVGGLHLRTKHALDFAPRRIVLVGPARVAHGIYIDERHFDRFSRVRRQDADRQHSKQ